MIGLGGVAEPVTASRFGSVKWPASKEMARSVQKSQLLREQTEEFVSHPYPIMPAYTSPGCPGDLSLFYLGLFGAALALEGSRAGLTLPGLPCSVEFRRANTPRVHVGCGAAVAAKVVAGQ